MVEIERIDSGIPGLDKLMEGGFVKGSTNLIAGSAGTCKTIFSMQFILHGLQKGEPGVYITLEQKPEDILEDMAIFGWDFKKYIDSGKFILESFPPVDIVQIRTSMLNAIKRINAKRFVLDSLSIAAMGWKEKPEEVFKMRGKIFDVLTTLKTTGVTSLLISEIPRGEKEVISRFGFEEFIVDSVILLQSFTVGGPMRSLHILKMRRTNHEKKIYPFDVTNKGIVVKGF
ncbi:MAG: ATPase domain-containing protein [Candidatus Aenigmatarchaeota archaeon]